MMESGFNPRARAGPGLLISTGEADSGGVLSHNWSPVSLWGRLLERQDSLEQQLVWTIPRTLCQR
jgi:hypothetical protein